MPTGVHLISLICTGAGADEEEEDEEEDDGEGVDEDDGEGEEDEDASAIFTVFSTGTLRKERLTIYRFSLSYTQVYEIVAQKRLKAIALKFWF